MMDGFFFSWLFSVYKVQMIEFHSGQENAVDKIIHMTIRNGRREMLDDNVDE